jgi:uncharacterized protein (DUF433 family)
MKQLSRITADPTVMGGKPCVRGQRVTVGMLTGLVASGKSMQPLSRNGRHHTGIALRRVARGRN